MHEKVIFANTKYLFFGKRNIAYSNFETKELPGLFYQDIKNCRKKNSLAVHSIGIIERNF